MKSLRLTFAAGLLGLFCANLALAANRDRHVVLISIDGFPAYLWHDETLPLPNLRRLAAEGAVADAMTVANPTITWPNHTTLVTGVTPRKHGVLYNALVTRQGAGQPTKSEQWADKAALVRVPTVYDAAFAAGLTTAESDWVAITRAATVTWSFAELVDPAGVLPREMIAAGAATPAEIEAAHTGKPSIIWRDEMWYRAAAFVFEKHQPNLLLYHPLGTDSVHHRYGPGSLASFAALALVDRRIGDLLRTIEASGVRAQTTVIVTTDHGFKNVDRYVHANVVLRRAGLLEAQGTKVVQCAAYVGTQGGIAFVYITDPARRAELLPKLKELFAHTEGIAQVIDAADAPKLGMPTSAENEGMGELILYPKSGYALNGDVTGDAIVSPTVNYSGTHGFPASDPELDGIFIASGAGIKKGVKLARVSNLDVAPTIARLLDLEFPSADGQPMKQILTEAK